MNLFVLGAMFARSNYGQPPANDSAVKHALKFAHCNTESAVESILGDLMEADEQYDMFVDEAHSWVERFKDQEQIDVYRRSSPRVFEQYDRCAAS